MRMRWTVLLAWALAALPALAQVSTSYRLEEHVFGAAGHPSAGTIPSSASVRITLDSLGAVASAHGLASPSYAMDVAFAAAYPPPGEVQDLRFAGKTTLVWDPEVSASAYNVYRDALTSLAGLGFGACLQSGVAGATALVTDVPAPGAGFFYLVTVDNRLAEEGTKGFQSNGAERANAAPCQ